MNIAQIENNLQVLVKNLNKDSFIYDLLLSYGTPKSSITRLQKGNINLSKVDGELAWKKKLFFKVGLANEDLHELINNIITNERAIKHDPRFIIVTDFKSIIAIDRKTSETLDIPILEIARHFDFLLPIAGMEKSQHQSENPADVKAAEKMAKLYDEIKKDNPTNIAEEVHNLNVFLSRLLFCFFAEDTGIFPHKAQFTNGISSHTQPDGSDLNSYLDTLYEVMNTNPGSRNSLPAFLETFPYVNGGLFRNRHQAPVFQRRSRQTLIECGGLQWKDIHPDIFGSMIQAVIKPEDRGGFGMHYTSVPNIMKVIEPLFLNQLYEELEAAKFNPSKLNKLLERLSKIKLFDPACGSGNFLIIAYKELRLLEMKILQQLQNLRKAATGFEPKQLELIPKSQLTLAASYQHSMFSRIELSQFYGIELDDFAHEIAILSLWLAQHQMNMKFKEVFGTANPTLPLQSGGNIIHGNATRIDWERVCAKEEEYEIYLLGNPPYRGKKEQTVEQKNDLQFTCVHLLNFKNLDFISCWFVKASRYITTEKIKCAFVSTNSICQGEQVGIIWPSIFANNIEIFFAYTSFMWRNNAKKNAGVAVVVIGIQKTKKNEKTLFSNSGGQWHSRKTSKINPYLSTGSDVIVGKRYKPLSDFPEIFNGSMANDDGLFFIEEPEYNSKNLEVKRFYKKAIGAKEFFYNLNRYTLWIEDSNLTEALMYDEIKKVIKDVKKYRLKSDREATRKLAEVSYRYGEVRYKNSNGIVVPGLSAERRAYIPLGFVTENTIVTNLCQIIYTNEVWLFGVLSSKMNNLWVRSTSGYFKKDIRYSPILSYNSFPFPFINTVQKREIERNVFNILSEREAHSEKTLAELYDPVKMPKGLKESHYQLDLAIERCYRSRPFESDEERLEYLFKLYEQMIVEERRNSGELIFEQQKKRKRK